MNDNNKKKITFLKALAYMAEVDGKISEDEKKYILEIGKKRGFSVEEITRITHSVVIKEEKPEVFLSYITEQKDKVQLVYNLVELCHSDGRYSKCEMRSIRGIIKILNIENDKLSDIEEVITEKEKLDKKIDAVLAH